MSSSSEKIKIERVAEAARTAHEVALTASKVAEGVADTAKKTAEQVMLYARDFSQIQKDISEIKARLDQKYVSFDVFNPVKEQTKDQDTKICAINDWMNRQLGRQSILVVVSSVLTGLAFFLLQNFNK